jgi:predicted amidophosphoribosyltransferase
VAGTREGAPAGWVPAGWRALSDLVLPRACAGCGIPDAVLCPRCRRRLARPRLAQPRRHPVGFPPTVAAGAYAGPVRSAVLAFKEHGRSELSGPLGVALALAVAAALGGLPGAVGRPVLLVPVPSSRAALRRRGRDHVGELAAAAGAELRRAGVSAAPCPVLRHRGRSRDSAGLGATERRANLAGRLQVTAAPGRVPAGAVLVLVDDVVTSGATLTEAARELAGFDGRALGTAVLAAVVAATPRRAARQVTGNTSETITVRN